MTCVILSAATLFPRSGEPLSSHIFDGAPPGRSAQLLRMDRLCGLSLCVADRVLLASPAAGRFDPNTTAILVGSRYGCHKSDEDFFRGLLEGQPSPRLFAYTLPSSPVGEVSIHHELRGPGLSIVSGRTAGLEALAQATLLLESGQAQTCLVIGCEAASPSLIEHATDVDLCDGAAAILLTGATADAGHGYLAASSTNFVANDPAAALFVCIEELCKNVPACRNAALICDPQTRSYMPSSLVYETPPCGAAASIAVLAGLGTRTDADAFVVLSADPAGLGAAVLWRRGMGG